ncbi:hypothetical protein B4U37_03935 [Sutcliffiella horikoshii]|uniref:Uncharacterized protein n=1 Tax=Sutcliffiella horikoshii TaxID=79883 RepID=A0ABM6KFW6_9BACI|nr:hypothetical protein [Sutcliffiella horikoshii]ART75245.1 hypothetical protein B4U37_03935 [Sutcliffiella horikoshii]
MSRETWKKVFSTIPDVELVELADFWSIQVKGFRQINQENIKHARAMVITEALKPRNLKMIKAYYTINDDETDEPADKGEEITLDALIEIYEEGKELHLILGGLYASEEEKFEKLALELEEALLEKYKVDDLSSLVDSKEKKEDEVPQEKGESKSTSEWEKKWNKSEDKNKDLRAKIGEWEKKYSQLKQQSKEEKQSALSEKFKLQQELGTERAQHRETVENNKKTADENETLKEEVAKLKGEISHLNAMLLHQQQEVAATAAKVDEKQPAITDQKEVVLVGDPKNKLTENSAKHTIRVLELKDVPEALESDWLEKCDEVWMMTYLVPPQVRRKIKRTVQKSIKEFSDFPTMKRYIEKG